MSTAVEYRAWVTVPGLRFEDGPAWESTLQVLERDHGELGPVIAWPNAGDAQVILATSAVSAAAAARQCLAAVAGALDRVGVSLYPASIELEAVDNAPELDGSVPPRHERRCSAGRGGGRRRHQRRFGRSCKRRRG